MVNNYGKRLYINKQTINDIKCVFKTLYKKRIWRNFIQSSVLNFVLCQLNRFYKYVFEYKGTYMLRREQGYSFTNAHRESAGNRQILVGVSKVFISGSWE